MRRLLLAAVGASFGASAALAADLVVGPGGAFATIQGALDAAQAGDTVLVRERATPYAEKVTFPRSGDATAGFITLRAWPGEHPVLDGTGVAGKNMVLIDSRSWVRVEGLELRNNLGVNDGSGVRVLGAGSHIEIRGNHIHDMRGTHAMGITVYATEPTPISDLVIDGNLIHDCQPFSSEALTLNGNVDGFAVTNNVVRDVNNIGIDFIGGETDIQPDKTKVVRNGVCRGNRVERARSIGGGGFAGGIYVDGGKDIVIERNVVTESDLGIEVGAENRGLVTSGIVVRENLVYRNEKVGIVFGGYGRSRGRVKESRFHHNTLWENDTLGAGFGELWIQFAEENQVDHNLLVAGPRNRLLTSDAGNVDNILDWNLWYANAGAPAAEFVWNGDEHVGFDAYRAATGQDAHSRFDPPGLASPVTGDFHLAAGSAAIDAGDPAFTPDPGETDLDGAGRVSEGRVDLGADESCLDGCC